MSIAITLGEPAGIGADILIQLVQRAWPTPLIVLGDPDVLSARAKLLGLPLQIKETEGSEQTPLAAEEMYCKPFSFPHPVTPGVLNAANVPVLLEILRYAGQACLEKKFDAVVTAPVHKSIINDAGFYFCGHTEFFAKLAKVNRVVMLLMNARFKMALVTTHLPLKKVVDAITQDMLTETIEILNNDLKKYFKLKRPRIAVCGLNPHAGEGGYLGDEEKKIISPVLTALKEKGLDLQGPLSADTIFMENADVILAMYHDQGLPLLKLSDFHHAVNLTLGLPFIRASVDHGTALNLAGTGRADARSLISAVKLAIELIHAVKEDKQ
ncbi:MAG: 4-hydroxythreonine-4-phosphate dehydrogenase PdxA [Gammaproteobacteria bacterium RIFCSPLOWO2_02_FULL_38_11]|nr:MAG: 4-hydroxythreonine-4-phosphate dehydrogenase PdxA [Gammaproteobacteria bacterium RIFCSPHIGHO2_02_FULL_38_33]OGT24597.1 MAG: 4-hydroxythreonine-4-phosphate dehydrogenase PdxA [Gammaproteobacteria bacterium RIFCSPHIGHO2_12_38_15]OGT69025.1 MAG: 4-hydroxythreonine-4-phosphate dehydrogenase PdxA [Gammaproteobacteria bacterium RIFCSPLOWO2_02_FULL_38_11]OGT75752.1 MAG: 4-hydroxythreonine-4-phosphate dehydrogenase PdxA [Gammaproteobacteria bacterium RIFCSPLOWO2_12_FULL_38_14]